MALLARKLHVPPSSVHTASQAAMPAMPRSCATGREICRCVGSGMRGKGKRGLPSWGSHSTATNQPPVFPALAPLGMDACTQRPIHRQQPTRPRPQPPPCCESARVMVMQSATSRPQLQSIHSTPIEHPKTQPPLQNSSTARRYNTRTLTQNTGARARQPGSTKHQAATASPPPHVSAPILR